MEHTEPYGSGPGSVPARRIAGLASAAGLGTAAAIHAAWAVGSTWPRADADALADLVVGRRPFPSAAATWAVAALLAGATGVVGVAATSGRHARNRATTTARHASAVVAAVLALRGAGGLAVAGRAARLTTDEFARMDLRVYSPLCLGLAAGAAVAARRA
ncbi:MAG: DUF3995 domain-containing protein [Actinomycetota bacterium]|nr:DUF3995 domain-containing protein [Actinomycetota bacterium]